MGALRESAASVRFRGDDLDPDEVTRILKVQPTKAWKKGGLRRLGNRGRELPATAGHWGIYAPREKPGDLDKQIMWIFAQATDDLVAWRTMSERFEGDVFVGLFLSSYNEGISLLPTTLSAIGERGLLLDLDIYARLDDDKDG